MGYDQDTHRQNLDLRPLDNWRTRHPRHFCSYLCTRTAPYAIATWGGTFTPIKQHCMANPHISD